jgi:hypothetical protein
MRLGVLELLSGIGQQLLCASAIVLVVAICITLVQRIRKGLVISPMGPLSDVVVLSLFLTPPTSLGAFFGNMLGGVWEPAMWVLTAVGAFVGLIIGIYLWLELH